MLVVLLKQRPTGGLINKYGATRLVGRVEGQGKGAFSPATDLFTKHLLNPVTTENMVQYVPRPTKGTMGNSTEKRNRQTLVGYTVEVRTVNTLPFL